MTVSRRAFLRASSAAAFVPAFPGLELLAVPGMGSGSKAARKLVVIHLDGGNDGINTVVPHGDPAYAEVRKTLRQRSNRLHAIGDGLGLHSALADFKALWDEGQLAIVQGVGYPDPSRSHFLSTAIWETAIRDPQKHAGVGWIGAALDRSKAGGGDATPTTDSIYIGSKGPPIALNGRRSQATNLTSLRDFRVPATADLRRVAKQTMGAAAARDDRLAFLSRVALGAYDAADRMSSVQTKRRKVRYPTSLLAQQLELAATLIGNEHPARVYYLAQPGYDTHSQQQFTHAQLLQALATSVRAFLADIADLGRADSVAVMMFSEFGRTVKENGSAGTDHGTAGPVFFAGAPVRKGLVGETPSLTDLVEDELRWSIDFRRIYATVGTKWFGLPPSRSVGGAEAKPLPLFVS